MSFEFWHLEAANLVPECERKHGREEAGASDTNGVWPVGQTQGPQNPREQHQALRLPLELEPSVASPSDPRAEEAPDGRGVLDSAVLGTIEARFCA